MLLELIAGYVSDKRFLYQLIATLTTYSAINLILFIRVRKRRHQLFRYYGIPGPKPRLLDGNLNALRSSKHLNHYYAKCHEKYGNVFGIYVGDEPSLMITDLEILRKVFFERNTSFKWRSFIFIDTPLTDSILFAKYDRWKFFRKVMSPLFSSYQVRGQSSTMFIEESIKLMLDYIEQRLDSNAESQGETSIDMHDLMKATALHMISSLAINIPVQVRENEEHVRSLDGFLSQADKGLVIAAICFPFLGRIMSFLAKHFEHGKTMAVTRRILEKRIDQSLKILDGNKNKEALNPKQQNLMDLLIRLYHEKKITRTEIIGNADAILFAGYDTTSTTLTYLFWVAGKYPEVQERLRTELATHGIESKYLEQVINETMRLYPTVNTFVSRVATETVTIGDLVIPQGAKVVYNATSVHLDPKVWPEPTRFDPERFDDPSSIHPCAFGPFGFSDRKCLGYSLAMLELKMVVCDILLKYRLKLKSPQTLELVSYATSLTKPKEKVLIELERLGRPAVGK